MNICVVGAGYVGITTALGLNKLGHRVACVDKDRRKISSLQQGHLTIFEPGLEELLRKGLGAGRLHFHSSLEEGLNHAHLVFLAVQTPSQKEGKADLSYLFSAARELADKVNQRMIIVNKSTAPPGTARKLQKYFDSQNPFCPVLVNPEFLREGTALKDFISPDRIIVGAQDERAQNTVVNLYQPLNSEILSTSWESAELIKYASNAFLATKVSFANFLARLSDECGANIDEVATGIGLDRRIGPEFLRAGIGYGGSCFPKDVSALIQWALEVGLDFRLLREVQKINEDQLDYVLQGITSLVKDLAGKAITLLGLAFKADTDDIRESPGLRLASLLEKRGSILAGYDPYAMKKVSREAPFIRLCSNIRSACQGADAVVVLTDWREFCRLDLKELRSLVRQRILIDTRNLYTPEFVTGQGWEYWGVGRP